MEKLVICVLCTHISVYNSTKNYLAVRKNESNLKSFANNRVFKSFSITGKVKLTRVRFCLVQKTRKSCTIFVQLTLAQNTGKTGIYTSTVTVWFMVCYGLLECSVLPSICDSQWHLWWAKSSWAPMLFVSRWHSPSQHLLVFFFFFWVLSTLHRMRTF